MDEIFGSFIWDVDKEKNNVLKHKVSFIEASEAFRDPQQKIFVDSQHSHKEPRYFCIAKVQGKIMTVRFTYRDNKIRIFGAGYWRKGVKYYHEKKI